MERMVKDNSSLVIQGWMISQLNLSGNELIVYAVIYMFSQDGQSEFYGSRQYLAEWTGSSIRTIQNCLNNLVDQGLIEPITKDFGSTVHYKANISPVPNSAKIAQGCAKIALNNKDNNKDINNSIINNTTAKRSTENDIPKRVIPLINDDISDKGYNDDTKKENKRLNLFDKCLLEIDNFTTDENLKKALIDYLTLRLKMKDKPIYGVGQWKGLLKNLSHLDGDKVAIVERATERGWGAFFAIDDLKQSKKKPNREIFGETDAMTNLRPDQVEGGNSSGIIF